MILLTNGMLFDSIHNEIINRANNKIKLIK